jgi:hypothetical protein
LPEIPFSRCFVWTFTNDEIVKVSAVNHGLKQILGDPFKLSGLPSRRLACHGTVDFTEFAKPIT